MARSKKWKGIDADVSKELRGLGEDVTVIAGPWAWQPGCCLAAVAPSTRHSQLQTACPKTRGELLLHFNVSPLLPFASRQTIFTYSFCHNSMSLWRSAFGG